MRYTMSMEQEKTHSKRTPITISIPAAIITGAVIIGIAILVALPPALNKKNQQPNPQKEQAADTTPTSVPAEVVTVRPTDHIRGDKNADIIIFEYSDSDCAYCQRFHPTMKTILSENKGSVAWVYRFFPLDMHQNAYTEAVALQCAGELGGATTFASYLDNVINVTLSADPKSNEALTLFAKQAGLDTTLFKKCLASDSTRARIDADIKEAGSIGAQGTPFSIAVNTKTGKQVVIAGAYPLEKVRSMIESIR